MTCSRKRTTSGGVVGLLAPAVIALVLAGPAHGNCPNSDCLSPPGTPEEGEACLVDNDEDLFNSGCNADVPAISDFVTVGIGTGEFLDAFWQCGLASNFRFGDVCVDDLDCTPPDTCDNGLCAPSDRRDTDWYVVPLVDLTPFDVDLDGRMLISARLRSEFDGTVFLVALDGVGGFCDSTTLDFASTDQPPLGGCSDPSQIIQAVITLADAASGISIVVVPLDFGAGVECSLGNNEYSVEIWGSDVLAVCDVGAGPCNEVNASPGCEDAECCALVCADSPICCLIDWNQGCVDLAIIQHGCAFLPYSCDGPDLTQPDCCDALSASPPLIVFDGDVINFDTTLTNSDGAPEGSGGDCIPNTNTGVGRDTWYVFEATQNGTLTVSTCNTASFDNILEAYDIGAIGSPYDCDDIKAQVGQIACNDTGGQGGVGACTQGPDSEDTAFIHFEVGANTQVLIRMGGFNGAGGMAVDFGTGSISFDFIPGDTLYDTGPHETVLFDGTATLLGWSSGNLVATGLDTQRRCVQAFTLPEIVGPGNAWQITEIYFGAFQVGGTTNEDLTLEIFSRTPGPNSPADWPGLAPGPADSLVSITMPIPIASEFPGRPAGNDDNYAANLLSQNLVLPPGNYWLTQFASNTSKAFAQANLAWLTNAHSGINNFCAADSPADYPDPAATQLGCSTTPDGTPGMFRARIYPPEADPDAGFRSYVLATSVLDIDPVNDPSPDAADLYNASFQIRGIVTTAGVPCPWDCGGDNNGEVGIVDFLALLSQWTLVGTTCDFGLGDPGVGINEFLDLLGHWGPCP